MKKRSVLQYFLLIALPLGILIGGGITWTYSARGQAALLPSPGLNPVAFSACSRRFNFTTSPMIRVISPNGGEIYNPGDPITVKWTSCNIPAGSYVGVNIIWPASWNVTGSTFMIVPNTGTTTFTLPENSRFYHGGLQSGSFYKMTVSYFGMGPNSNVATTVNPGTIGFAEDSSDKFFSIITDKDQASSCFPRNSWTQKANFGINAYGGSGFSAGGKGYVETGLGSNDFWEYNPMTNIWIQKANFGARTRGHAAEFSIGNKLYLGTGWDGIGNTKAFWEYDVVTNVWTRKADFPGTARYYAVGFSVGTKGYIGTGRDSSGLTKDFWEYDPVTDTWTRKADFAGGPRWQAVGFSIGNKGYLGTGNDALAEPRYDFWEYDPALDRWTQKTDFAGGSLSSGIGFSIGRKGYLGIGAGYIGAYSVFWEYDPNNNTWAQKADFTATRRWDTAGFSVAGKGYVWGGYPIFGGPLPELWEYCPG